MNKVILCGNLTRDVDLKSGNTTYARIGLAVNRPRSTKKEVDFFNLVAFGKTAEVMAKYLSKGSKILVEGQLRFSQYETDYGQRVSLDLISDYFVSKSSDKKAFHVFAQTHNNHVFIVATFDSLTEALIHLNKLVAELNEEK